MFSLIALGSAIRCPQGIRYFQSALVNFTLVPNEFTYFYTTPPLDKTVPISMNVKSPEPVKIFVGDFSYCPDNEYEPFLITPGRNQWVFGETHFRNESSIRAVTIGLLSEHEQTIFVDLIATSDINVGRNIMAKVILLAIAMIFAAVAFFCFGVLPGPKHEKLD